MKSWEKLAAELANHITKAAALMHETKEDVIVIRRFCKDHCRKIWSIYQRGRIRIERILALLV